jgi:hypothetical protein
VWAVLPPCPIVLLGKLIRHGGKVRRVSELELADRKVIDDF